MSNTVTSSYEREAEVAEKTNKSRKKEEQTRDAEEDDELIKEFFTKDIVVFETIVLCIERVPMFCLIFFSLFPRCFRTAAEILSYTNLTYAVLFIGRLLFFPSAIGFDFLFFSERIAFLIMALVYYLEYSIYWEVAAAIFVVTNMIRIALITHNWSSIKAQIREKFCYIFEDMSDHKESDDAESEDEFEVEEDETPKKKRAISKEADSKLCEEPQKTNEIDSEHLETRDDQKKDEFMIGKQEEQAKDEEKSKSYIEEEDNHDGAFLRHKKFLGDINLEAHCLQLEEENSELLHNLYAATETLEHYRRIEKSFSNCEEEKKDLAAKLDDAIEKLRHYQQEKKDFAAKLDDAVETLRLYQHENNDLAAELEDTTETLRHCQKEKKDLAVKLDDNVETLRHYQSLVQDYHFNDHRKWEKEKQNLLSEHDAFNSPLHSAANPSSDQYNPPSRNAVVVQNVSSATNAANAANYQSDFDDPHSSQFMFNAASATDAANAANYQSDVDGAHTSPLMFPRGLASADAQYSGGCERIHGAILEAKPFSWEQERNDLTAKLTATSAWYHYYVHAAHDYQLQNHNLLVERNDLSAKLQSANTSAEFYKACLDDSDDECRKLREENNNLSAKLFAETASAEYYHKLVNEMEEKCRKLKEEKNELVPKLYAAKAASQLYRSYLHDAGSLGV